MIIFIVPVFQKLFASLGGQAAVADQVLIDISKIITAPGSLVIIAVIIGSIVVLRKWIKTEKGRLQVGRASS